MEHGQCHNIQSPKVLIIRKNYTGSRRNFRILQENSSVSKLHQKRSLLHEITANLNLPSIAYYTSRTLKLGLDENEKERAKIIFTSPISRRSSTHCVLFESTS